MEELREDPENNLKEKNKEEVRTENAVGKFLKKKREQLKITLEEASTQTRINIKSLQSLENGEIEKLPAIAYVKGFIKNYSQFLKLDPEEALKLFQQEHQDRSSQEASQFQEAFKKREIEMKKNSDHKLKMPKLNLRLFFVLIPLLFLSLAVYWVSSHKESLLSFFNKSEKSSKTIASNLSIQKAKTQIQEKIATTTTTIPVTTTTLISLPDPKLNASLPYVKFKPLRNPNYRISEEDSSDEIPDKYIHKSKSVNGLFISAERGDSWIRYRLPSGIIKSFMLKLGEARYIQGNQIFLILGNASGLDLYLNNQKVLLSSKVYQILSFPIDLYKKHKEPLFIDTEDGRTLFYTDYLKEMIPN